MNMSIVIPCYNEEKNLNLILERFSQVIDKEDLEVVLVDNGSSDGTEKVLEELLPQYPFARSIKVEVNQGYGYGILQGLKACDSEYIGWTHADMQTDPNDVIVAYNKIKKRGFSQNVYLKGNRKGRGLFDNIFTFGMSVFETIYLKSKLYDINAQPNIFSKVFFETWQQPPYDFSLDLYAYYMARKNNIEIIRFDVLFPERIHGTSHWNNSLKDKWKFIKRTVEFSTKLKKRGLK